MDRLFFMLMYGNRNCNECCNYIGQLLGDQTATTQVEKLSSLTT